MNCSNEEHLFLQKDQILFSTPIWQWVHLQGIQYPLLTSVGMRNAQTLTQEKNTHTYKNN